MDKVNDGGWTPGPWWIERDGKDLAIHANAPHGLVYVIAERIGGQVRPAASGKFTDRSEVESNAALLLAARELYVALEGVLRVADRATEEFDTARAALAKARGAQ